MGFSELIQLQTHNGRLCLQCQLREQVKPNSIVIFKALAVQFVDGILYAISGDSTAGGEADSTNVNEAYDPITNIWTTKTPIPTARNHVGILMFFVSISSVWGD